ncbi:DUF6302 family protein [Streptomyces olivoreticuli]
MSASTLPPDIGRYQPECALPPWSSTVLPTTGSPVDWPHLRDRLSAYQDLLEVADADATYDLLEEVMGEHAAPGPEQTKALTLSFLTVLGQLVVHDHFLHARHPGRETRQTIERARTLLQEQALAEPTRAGLRRLAHTTLAVLDLAGEAAPVRPTDEWECDANPSLKVTILPPWEAYDYESVARRLADPSLLAMALAVRTFRAPLLVVPVGSSRRGGCLTVDHELIARDVVAVLRGRPGFPRVHARRTPGAGGGWLVEWGESAPNGLSAVARDRFFGLTEPVPDYAEFTARDVEALRLLAHGAGERALVAHGLYRTSAEALRSVGALGRALNRGVGVRWTGIVHLAIVHGLVAACPTLGVSLPPYQMDLLRAWSEGMSLQDYADRARINVPEAWELAVLVCGRLEAHGDQHAVLRGHEARLLPRGQAGTGHGLAAHQLAEARCNATPAAPASRPSVMRETTVRPPGG